MIKSIQFDIKKYNFTNIFENYSIIEYNPYADRMN